MTRRDKHPVPIQMSDDECRHQDQLDMARFDDESSAPRRLLSCMGQCPIAKRINALKM